MAVNEPLAQTSIQPTERPKITYEEFLASSGEDLHAEWVNGEVIVHMTAKPLHQKILGFLYVLLEQFVRVFDLGEVFMAPTQMKATPTGSGREPDIFFVAREHLDRVLENRLAGPADLVVEIISDDSVSRDLDEKFFEYQEAGVPEYWIIDPRPRRQRAWFYQRDARGQYQTAPVGDDGIYRSTSVPGFWINVNWLWQEDLPDPLSVFAEIAGFTDEMKNALRTLKQKGRPA
ncbi:MAG: Uma2 family endonuclease [Chloroflexi bacterium]|nr:Uma2 family endonuclease [Chloroflexota bacterium]